MKNSYRVSDLIIKNLEKNKVKNIFLLPGGGNMFLIDAVKKSKIINGIPFHHEQAATIAAESSSRIHNNIGVAIVTTGPGSSNALTGLLGSWIESIPLIVISGQVKTTDIKKKIKLRQQGVQGANILSMVKKITKYSVQLKKIDNFKIILDKAISIAKNGRPGPVWIEVPLDVQSMLVRKKEIKIKKNKKEKFTFSNKIKNKIKKLLEKSKRPVFLIGHGVRLSGANKDFVKLINKLKIPCVFTWNAMDTLEHDHSLNFGRPGVVAQRYSNFVVQNSDLLISIGCRIDNIITAFNEKNFAKYAKKIIVDIDKNELKKFSFKNSIKLNFNARFFINELLKINILKNKNLADWMKKCKFWKSKYNYENEKKVKKNKIDHYYCVLKLSELIPKKSMICTGSSGLAVEIFYTIFKNKYAQRIFLTSGLGSMGYGLPSSIGACISNNKKPIFLVEGDGSLQQNIQELAVIKKFKLPITIFIFNNNGYCSIKNTQKNYFNKRYLGIDKNSKLYFPDLKKIANAYGIEYIKISSKSDLDKRLRYAIKRKNVAKIVDINVSNEEILAPKVSAIIKNGSIISMPLEDMSPLLPIKLLKKEMYFKLSKESIIARKNLDKD